MDLVYPPRGEIRLKVNVLFLKVVRQISYPLQSPKKSGKCNIDYIRIHQYSPSYQHINKHFPLRDVILDSLCAKKF